MDFFGGAADQLGLGKTHKLDTNPAVLDPNYTGLVNNVAKTARDYRKNLPGMLDQQKNIAQDSARMDLAREYNNADRSANARGLFYGGKRAGMRGQAESAVAGDLASNLRNINISGENTASGLENTAIEAAYGMKNDQQQIYDDAYNEALSRRQSEIDKRKGFGNTMGTAGGGLIGGLLGGMGSGGLTGGGKSNNQANNAQTANSSQTKSKSSFGRLGELWGST